MQRFVPRLAARRPWARPVVAPANWPAGRLAWSGVLAPEVHLVAGNRQSRLAAAGATYGRLAEVRQLAAPVVDTTSHLLRDCHTAGPETRYPLQGA